MKATLRILYSLLLFALLFLPTFAVLAKELGLLTISGPGIKGEMTIDNPSQLQSLWEAGIIDTNGFAKAPDGLGAGYTISTFMRVENNELIPFIQMVYYPAEPGQAGYVHIIGRLEQGNTLSPADQWTRMSLSADKALRTVMSAHAVELQAAFVAAPAAAAPAAQAAQPAADPAAQSAAQSMPAPSPAVAWGAIALTAIAVLLLGRRSLSRRTA